MIQKIRRYIQQNNLISEGDRIVIGISGGADSVALLLVLRELAVEFHLKLWGVHIHHGIRKEADLDMEYVKNLCQGMDIPCEFFCADIPALAKEQGKTEEEMGRDYRYQCFYEVAVRVSANKIAVAHHENDQAETVLFHLIRGTDLQGLSGMYPIMERFPGIDLIRPLLCVNRGEIEGYLKGQGISWQEDASNMDNRYARNALRNVVIPAMEKMNSQTVNHIVELSNQMREYHEYFEKQVMTYLKEHLVCSQTDAYVEYQINREHLGMQERIFAQRVLYTLVTMISGGKKDISREHMDALYGFLDKQSGKTIDLPYGVRGILVYENLILRKCFDKDEINKRMLQHPGKIFLEGVFCSPSASYHVDLGSQGILYMECKTLSSMSEHERENILKEANNGKNNYTKYFDCDTIEDKLCVRTPMAQDYICINENGNKKKLSKFFKDEKISSRIRDKLPLLTCGQEVLYVVGYRRCENYKVTRDTKRILVVTYEGEKNGAY